ncbi:uncharacterized protein LOC123429961 isoform X1 [Hordeum vulgare subsp. vulgare]|uniref:uncharacterized protein LOC123429961 isoform X1 n=1 Tax=Hordeum vulgare subsp. vulgare TaxID=112509 RepID=UPI000B477B56|nr:uncharacterized protein LOC123429961 isoform X1 [Hordeum vulgare subsp. vulgare]
MEQAPATPTPVAAVGTTSLSSLARDPPPDSSPIPPPLTPNGLWWPGKAASRLEVPDDCLVLPRSPATPILLLDRCEGTAFIEWCNLERSKRVKPFRCGEADLADLIHPRRRKLITTLPLRIYMDGWGDNTGNPIPSPTHHP